MNKNKKERLENKLRELFYGDGSEDASGLTWWELKKQNIELTGKEDADLNSYIHSDYVERRNSIIQTLYDYQACVYSDEETDENFSIKFLKFIKYLLIKVEEDKGKDIIHYISRSISNCTKGNTITDKAKLTNSLLKLKKLAESLGLNIHINEHQNMLAEQLVQKYLECHYCNDVNKKRAFYLKRIKLLAQLDNAGAESMYFDDPASESNKIDVLIGQNYNTQSNLQDNNNSIYNTEINYRLMFHKIEVWFKKKQDRKGKSTKEYLSALVTYSLIRIWYKQDALEQLFFDLMKEYSFTDLMIWAELQNCWNEGKKLPKQQEIAARFERDSTGKQRGKDDASRALRGFKNLILKSEQLSV